MTDPKVPGEEPNYDIGADDNACLTKEQKQAMAILSHQQRRLTDPLDLEAERRYFTAEYEAVVRAHGLALIAEVERLRAWADHFQQLALDDAGQPIDGWEDFCEDYHEGRTAPSLYEDVKAELERAAREEPSDE